MDVCRDASSARRGLYRNAEVFDTLGLFVGASALLPCLPCPLDKSDMSVLNRSSFTHGIVGMDKEKEIRFAYADGSRLLFLQPSVCGTTIPSCGSGRRLSSM